MVFETIHDLVLKFFHPLGFLKPVPLCKREGCGMLSGVRRGGEGRRRGRGRAGGEDTDLWPSPGQRCTRRQRCRCSCSASWRRIQQWSRSTPRSHGRTAAGAGPPRCRRSACPPLGLTWKGHDNPPKWRDEWMNKKGKKKKKKKR